MVILCEGDIAYVYENSVSHLSFSEKVLKYQVLMNIHHCWFLKNFVVCSILGKGLVVP